jgi:hypothetical protein
VHTTLRSRGAHVQHIVIDVAPFDAEDLFEPQTRQQQRAHERTVRLTLRRLDQLVDLAASKKLSALRFGAVSLRRVLDLIGRQAHEVRGA